ncbi:hypothetical protein AMTRI_Chr12g237290 [Amborella trichopoda]|uniref:GH18 domain-containing protein n=1 Tax=Amborella trichopoda TaxID=13333 RepID=W1PL78_AMBTC|nr:acidic mammalian chitinase [Amborella trichopoda]ERN08436.1 hypothetical protein AMTR_s00150p00033570 [Amborella trichopoda]|eukprot:XP_006846855.1 acidic mammalian chitinase [Amborella trichopoda]
MASWRRVVFGLILVLCFSGESIVSMAAIKAAYWPSWTNSYRPPSSIDTNYFTHLYYAFLEMDPLTFKLRISPNESVLLSEFTAGIKQRDPRVKTLVSIGGGGSNSTAFALMASSKPSRKIFIDSTVEVARKFGLHGLDLDWEFPANPNEMASLAKLFFEWRGAIEAEAYSSRRPRLLLTAAVYFSPKFFLSDTPRSYPSKAIKYHLDWVNAMCFDYRGSWDTSKTGAHAALYDPKSNISTSYGIDAWVRSGVPQSKLVMGLPLYGRTWKLKDPNVHGIGAPAVGVGPGDTGVLTYTEVVQFKSANNGTVVYDRTTVSTYLYAGDSWVGYDDAQSTVGKIRFAITRHIRGYFFWAVSYDQDWEISRQASEAWGHH